eukprot:GFYU01000049.1.p1 GENE.GFYU01000049.1~~GFYU01000049.1.p1  ORF type:complete len:399 (-),score=109.08 GFYU01000049.1:116-1312(-)
MVFVFSRFPRQPQPTAHVYGLSLADLIDHQEESAFPFASPYHHAETAPPSKEFNLLDVLFGDRYVESDDESDEEFDDDNTTGDGHVFAQVPLVYSRRPHATCHGFLPSLRTTAYPNTQCGRGRNNRKCDGFVKRPVKGSGAAHKRCLSTDVAGTRAGPTTRKRVHVRFERDLPDTHPSDPMHVERSPEKETTKDKEPIHSNQMKQTKTPHRAAPNESPQEVTPHVVTPVESGTQLQEQVSQDFNVSIPCDGLSSKDVSVVIKDIPDSTSKLLCVSGEKVEENHDEATGVQFKSSSTFSKQFVLPASIDPDKLKAKLRKGKLIIKAPTTAIQEENIAVATDSDRDANTPATEGKATVGGEDNGNDTDTCQDRGDEKEEDVNDIGEPEDAVVEAPAVSTV